MASILNVDKIRATGSTTDGLVVDSSGRVTLPALPFFHASITGSNVSIGTGSDAVLPFNNEITDVGGHFNNSTYKFTAPVNGVYQFTAAVRVDAVDRAAGYYRIGFRAEQGTGSAITAPDLYNIIDPDGYDIDVTYLTLEITRSYYLTAGNLVRATLRQQGGTADHAHVEANDTKYSYFSGYLVG